MRTLYLRFSPRFHRALAVCCGLAGLGLLCGLIGPKALAQDKQDPNDPAKAAQVQPVPVPPAAPMIKFRERPRYVSDQQRLRRTPQIDGVMADGEWDPFYTLDDGAVKGTVYCNWDDNNLYLAAKTDGPATILFDVDAGGDGWLRGADNVELVFGPPTVAGGAPTVTARLLDAANSKDTPTWNETAIDVKKIVAAETLVNGVQILEVAIPKNTGSLALRPGATLGIRGEFMPPGSASAYVPTQAFEPHLLLDATLVEARVVAASGINPKLTLSDYKCIPGQNLFATLELYNQTDLTVNLKSVLWAGTGASVNAVNTLREVNIKPIPGTKRLKLSYKTVLPENLAIGSYILNVEVETADGKRIMSAASFAVVEPIQVQMSVEPQPVAVLGPTKVDAIINVQSAVPNHFRGLVELTTVPSGWEVTNGNKHSLLVDREDSNGSARFNLKMPSNTPAGSYPIEATITWHNRVWKARFVAQVVRTDAPVKPGSNAGGTPPPANP